MTFVVQLFDSGSLNLNLWPLHLYVYLLGILPANTEKDKKNAVWKKNHCYICTTSLLLFYLEKKFADSRIFWKKKSKLVSFINMDKGAKLVGASAPTVFLVSKSRNTINSSPWGLEVSKSLVLHPHFLDPIGALAYPTIFEAS